MNKTAMYETDSPVASEKSWRLRQLQPITDGERAMCCVGSTCIVTAVLVALALYTSTDLFVWQSGGNNNRASGNATMNLTALLNSSFSSGSDDAGVNGSTDGAPSLSPVPGPTALPTYAPTTLQPTYFPTYVPTPGPTTAVPSFAPTGDNWFCCFESSSCGTCRNLFTPGGGQPWCNAEKRNCEGFCEGTWCMGPSPAPTSEPAPTTVYAPSPMPTTKAPFSEPTFSPSISPDAFCCFGMEATSKSACNTCANQVKQDDDTWCSGGKANCEEVCGGSWSEGSVLIALGLGARVPFCGAPRLCASLDANRADAAPVVPIDVQPRGAADWAGAADAAADAAPTPFVAAATPAPSAAPTAWTPVSAYGALSVVGSAIVSAKTGNAVQLRGMALSDTALDGNDAFYDALVVQRLASDWACNVVRCTMSVEQTAGYLSSATANAARVQRVVEACIDVGLYVVIAWQSSKAEAYTAEAAAFFGEMAELYKDRPNVLFEVYGRPIVSTWAGAIKPYAETVIDSIRGAGAENVVLVGSRIFCQRVDEAAADPILRSNALDGGIALFVTQWTAIQANGGGVVDSAEAALWRTFLDANAISHCASRRNWAFADSDDNAAALRPGTAAAGPWAVADMTDSGLLARDGLLSYPPKT
ncbi:glycoside hydrolase superfamily [Pelagophyceae sp. CCMP2097]|nr:glycoside hydrolase superfamily [Pelagophyceae sp. CCMP2097]